MPTRKIEVGASSGFTKLDSFGLSFCIARKEKHETFVYYHISRVKTLSDFGKKDARALNRYNFIRYYTHIHSVLGLKSLYNEQIITILCLIDPRLCNRSS